MQDSLKHFNEQNSYAYLGSYGPEPRKKHYKMFL